MATFVAGCKRVFEFKLNVKNTGKEKVTEVAVLVNDEINWNFGNVIPNTDASIVGGIRFAPGSKYEWRYKRLSGRWVTNTFDLRQKLPGSFRKELLFEIRPETDSMQWKAKEL